MTLNVLKWVYDLGVRQERVRIASHLRLELSRRHELPDVMYLKPRRVDSAEAEEERKKIADREAYVSMAIEAIINRIMRPGTIPGDSIMYPKNNSQE